MRHTLLKYAFIALALVTAASCHIEDDYQEVDRDHVMILYSAGFNSLSKDLTQNINELTKGYVPGKNSGKTLLVVAKNTVSGYRVQTSPYIIRMYRESGRVVMDTVYTYPKGTVLSSAETMRSALDYIVKNYPSNSYGMVFSSHGTGWLPAGYYNNPSIYENGNGDRQFTSRRTGARLSSGSVPYYELEQDPSLPGVKTIGQEVTDDGDGSAEMTISDFAAAIPVKLDYLLFDACLMGGVETAYELRNVTDKIGFSPAEILQYGFDYYTMGEALLKGQTPDPEKVCSSYFERYDKESGANRSATITLIDCSGIQGLASVCKDLFSKYREEIANLNYRNVQGYYRSNKKYFFDLYDILLKAGATEPDLKSLYDVIDKCIIYKASTPRFLNEFDIETYSGLSMYLPSAGTAFLDGSYKGLGWNSATRLVE